MPPSLGLRLMGCGVVAISAGGIYVFSAAAFTWAAQHPRIARLGAWSPAKLRAEDSMPSPISIACAVIVCASAAATCVVLVRHVRSLARVRAAVRQCGSGRRQVLVVPDAGIEAFTTAGRHGRIVVTSGLLDALSGPERRALFAHERSHLRHRHLWWTLAADLAATANPMLRAPGRAMVHAVERWADEDAAAQVGDRLLVARTLAHAALLRTHGNLVADATLHAVASSVPERVRAMLAPQPRRDLLAAAALTLMIVAAIVAVVLAQRSADGLFDAAQAAPA
jgi:beta-lactamase regulating signal transducer with metallopeptidase domain